MEFLYPFVLQFPFDEACNNIIHELEKRNWHVPGIEVEFYTYGSGAQKFRMVGELKGRDFRLVFHRVQRTMPGNRWNDTAAVTDLYIPKKVLNVYEDESGPTFYLYVGKDWERDREEFMTGSKLNSRLDRKPKSYLVYRGGCLCRAAASELVGPDWLTSMLAKDTDALSRLRHTHSRCRPPHLLHDNDPEREYSPEGSEPKIFDTDEVMEEFRRYLEEVVLPLILEQPLPDETTDSLAEPEPIPFPDTIGPIFCFGEDRDAERIKQGQGDENRLLPMDRYGLVGSGYRLVPLDINLDGTVPKEAYDGYLWCGLGEVTAETDIHSLDVPGHIRWSNRERYTFRVKPDRANSIFVADHGQYEKRRIEVVGQATLDGRKRLTDGEVAEIILARARTMVPLSEYRGGFAKPVLLIGRELGLHEVEVVSGPHRECNRC